MANAPEPARNSSPEVIPCKRQRIQSVPNTASACPWFSFVNLVVEQRTAKADGLSALATPPCAQGRFTHGSCHSCMSHSVPSPVLLGCQLGTEQLSHDWPDMCVALQVPNCPPSQPIAETRGGGAKRGRMAALNWLWSNLNTVSQSASAIREGMSLSDFLVNRDWPAMARFNQSDEAEEQMTTQKSYAAG